jgi:hypothetical protein
MVRSREARLQIGTLICAVPEYRSTPTLAFTVVEPMVLRKLLLLFGKAKELAEALV